MLSPSSEQPAGIYRSCRTRTRPRALRTAGRVVLLAAMAAIALVAPARASIERGQTAGGKGTAPVGAPVQPIPVVVQQPPIPLLVQQPPIPILQPPIPIR